ncbi:LacI family DNA-binding transcriptional regulator [Klebsiella sp. BIGb0407]|uniref:DNA-binding transcriptional regulator IdnR n=1 Tax=Klebsiella sp. BIGb0407 TaxID=2940603 RepID=UPI0021680140|nr:LacI family DNA-binding transcriptional regulator [Klebsiella sp. BIGb0407]MCS3430979.1 LacI family gluconate utilization system Gnt-II transcriptional activator [Klebsiella sp. BIGb0407]
MRSHRISLQDIATLAGVTKMTVSRYLRTPERVAPETGEKIAKIIEEINYIPNRTPEMLLNAKSYTLGVLIPSFKNQIFADLLSGIEAATKVGNYQILTANFNYDKLVEEEQIINLLSYNIDGILLTEKNHTLRAEKYLRAARIPIVEVMDSEGSCLDMQVGFNNNKAGYDMTRTLFDKGRTRIVYFGSRDDKRDEARYQGYCRAMGERGAEARRVNPKVVSSQKLGAEMMENALTLYPDLDAVFCTNDDLALGALVWCLRKKIPVPERIAVAGFHGLDISREMYPSMASVITPRYDIGYTAAELLLKKIAAPYFSTKTVSLDYQIFMGETI